MNIYFEQELANLRGYGIGICDLHTDEIVDLVRAADGLARPFSRVNQDAVGFPIEVTEGVCFWRLTVGASVWLDEYAKRWWLDTNRKKCYYWAVIYALRHGREPEAFIELRDEETAFKRIKADAIAIHATEAELNEAMDIALDIGVEQSSEAKRGVHNQANWGEVLTRLEAQTGIPIKAWSWDYSADHAIKAYRDLSRFASLYGAGRAAPRMRDELDVATTVLAHTRARIIKRIQDERSIAK